MSKGTILYVGGFELPDKNAAAHRVLSIGKIFKALDYRVVYIDVDRSLNHDSDFIDTKKDVQGFDCWSVSYPKKPFEWIKYLSNIDYLNEIEDLYKDVKLIIAYNYPAMALNNLRRYCAYKNIKIMSDCTEWYSTKGSNILFKIVKGLDSFIRMRIIQKKLDGMIVISKYLEEYYSKIKNVVRIPPLVDVYERKWSIDDQKLDETFGRNMCFLYSGSPGKNKDKIDTLIDALYRLREFDNYQMLIVGLSEVQFTNVYPKFKDKIEVLGGRIKFLGRVSHIDSIKELKKADYSVFIRERTRLTMAGFPTKFVESISCSTPVITTNSSDLKDFFEKTFCGYLIEDSSVNELEKSLRFILENDRPGRKNSYKIDNEAFHYKRYIGKIEEVLNKLLKNQ